MTDENKVVVFYDDLSSPFKKVAIALYEKDVIFDKRLWDSKFALPFLLFIA